MAVTKRTRKVVGAKKTVYQAEVFVEGVRLACKTFETKAQAYVWHDECKKEFSKKNPQQIRTQKMTVGECFSSYKRSVAFTGLRQSTKQSRGLRFCHIENTPLAEVAMEDLNGKAVDDWLEWLKKSPTATSKKRKSFEHEVELLSIVLNWYRNETNPGFVVPIVKRHRERAFYKEVEPRRPDYFMRPDEITLWLEYMETQRSIVYFQLAKFMVLSGTRLGEAAGLHWDAIDLNQKCAMVKRTTSWDQKTRKPYPQKVAKNEESIRLFHLPDELIEMLRNMQVQSRSPIVFPNEVGDYLRDNSIRSAFNRGFKAAKLPWTATRILRHTFATWSLVGSNSNIGAVQVALGHAKRTTTEVYAKPLAAFSGAVAQNAAKIMLPKRPVVNHGDALEQ